jgi:proteic killer suppression protein
MNITSFKHKGLEAFYKTGSHKGINADHTKKLALIFESIKSANDIDALNIPAFRLHQLKGDRAGVWSITIRANWRLTFMINGNDCHLLDYEDYH